MGAEEGALVEDRGAFFDQRGGVVRRLGVLDDPVGRLTTAVLDEYTCADALIG